MLVTLKGLLEDAKNKKQAVGAFNGTTLEGIRAIIGAAEEFQRPVILQHAQSHDTIIDLNEIAPLMLHYARSASVPVAVHLDHGSTFKRCMEAIRAGFTSVMYDASANRLSRISWRRQRLLKLPQCGSICGSRTWACGKYQ